MSWKTMKLGEVCTIEKGNIGIMKAIPGDYPLVVLGDERRSHNEYQFDTEAVIIPLVSSTGHGHRSMKRIHYQSGRFSVGNILCAVIPKDKTTLSTEFLYRYLDLNKEGELVSRMKGMANVSLPMKSIADVEIPVPPIGIQQDIIKRFDKVEKSNDALLSEQTQQLDYLKKLRQQILKDAMQGKLVQQDPNDEPANRLVEKIKIEKERLIKEKILKSGNTTEKSISLIGNLFIPSKWVWCKTDDIFFVTKLAGFEYTKHISLKTSGEIPVLRAQNIRPKNIDKSNLLYIDKATSFLLDRCSLTKKCLLVTFIGAGIGDVATFNEKERWHLAPNVAKVEPFEGCEEKINVNFINYFLMSPVGQDEIFKHVKATAQPSLSMGTIRDIDIPIPPLNEQNRIVIKMERLMKLCDELELSIKQNQKYTQELLHVALKEAIEPKTL